MSRQNKKDKFTQQNKKPNLALIVTLLVGALAIAGIFIFGSKDKAVDSPYAGRQIEQTVVNYEVKDGKVLIDEKELTSKEFIKFTIDQGKPLVLENGSSFNYLPVLAYKAPSGKLVGAVSLCEPCSGENFKIDGDVLFCKACGTTWDLETLEGIQGGCPDYPPAQLKVEIKDGKLVFDEKELKTWAPRPL